MGNVSIRNLSRQQVENLRIGQTLSEDDDTYTIACFGNYFQLVVLKDDQSLTPCLTGWSLPGLWEAWVTSWFTKNIKEKDVVVDVGANFGYYTMLSTILGAEVVAYEPSPVVAKLLRRTRDLNNANYKVYELALANRDGTTTLGQFENYVGSASIVAGYTDTKHKVYMTTLDRDFDYGFIPQPDIIKIDAESAEEMIWDGGFNTLKQTPVVILEWTPGAYSDVFANKLSAWGRLSVIDHDGNEVDIDVDGLNSLTNLEMIVVRNEKC